MLLSIMSGFASKSRGLGTPSIEKKRGRMMRSSWGGALVAVALGLVALPAHLTAQDFRDDKGWRFAATPWMWLINLDGDLTLFGREADVEIDTGEILDALEFAWMSHLEVGKGNVGFFIEPIIAKLGSDGTVQVPGVGPTEAEVDIDQVMLDLGGAYRVAGPFEVVGGARYFSLDLTTQLEGIGEESRDTGWWNGFVGGRIRSDFADRWGVLLHGDVGFGESESNYMTMGVLQYRFSPRWGVDFGYKWLHDEIDPEGRRVDWTSDWFGGVVGVTIRR
jgi:hypothetical protein